MSKTQVSPSQTTTSLNQDYVSAPPTEDEIRRVNAYLSDQTFNDLQLYFQQSNALRFTNPNTGGEWLTTPMIDMEIDGKTIGIVATVENNGSHTNPIAFFTGPTGVIGVLKNSQDVTDGFSTLERVDGSPIDFSKFSREDFMKFEDGLNQYFMERPRMIHDEGEVIANPYAYSIDQNVGHIMSWNIPKVGIIHMVEIGEQKAVYVEPNAEAKARMNEREQVVDLPAMEVEPLELPALELSTPHSV